MAYKKPDRNITIQIAQDFKDIKFSLPKIKRLIKTICMSFGSNEIQNRATTSRDGIPAKAGTKYEISIAIVNDYQFRQINSRFLDSNHTSDCLSFDLSDDKSQKVFELIVNGEIAKKQADLRRHSDEAELALYITHGLLHNLGFNDSTPSKACKMHDTEDKILQQFGYGLVYNKNISTHKHKRKRDGKSCARNKK